jgi:hypothetical protein
MHYPREPSRYTMPFVLNLNSLTLLEAENTSTMNGIRDDLLRTVHSLENVHSATEHSEEEESSPV